MQTTKLTYDTKLPEFKKGTFMALDELKERTCRLDETQQRIVKEITTYLDSLYYQVSCTNIDHYEYELPPSHLEQTNKNKEVLTITLPNVTQPHDDSMLSDEQLNSMWGSGTFKVKSSIEGVDNVWKITPWLVIGTNNIQKLYYNNFTKALSFYLTTVRFFELSRSKLCFNYIYSPNFWSGLLQAFCYILNVFELLAGLPNYMLTSNLYNAVESAIEERRNKYLRNQDFPKTKHLASQLQQKHFVYDNNKSKNENERVRKDIDAFNTEIEKNKSTLSKLHQSIINAYDEFETQQCKSLGDVYVEDYNRFKAELCKGKFDKILELFQIKCSGDFVIDKQTLSVKIRSLAIIYKQEDIFRKEIEKIEKTTEQEIRDQHPQKAKVDFWFKEELAKRMKLIRRNKGNQLHEDISLKLLGAGFKEDSELYKASTEILKKERDNKDSLANEIHTKLLKPNFTYTLYRRLWVKYKVKKVVTEVDTYYLNDHYEYLVVSSTFVFWRVYHILAKWLYYSLDLTFRMLQYAYSGEFGFKGLVYPTEYYRDYSVNYQTGVVTKDIGKVVTILKKFNNVMQGIKRSREIFEREPNVGMFGKNVARIFNCIENYFLRFFLVSCIVLGLIHPILNILTIFLCLFIALTSYAWAILYIGVSSVFRITIFDFEALRYDSNYATLRTIDNIVSPCRYFPMLQLIIKMMWGGFVQISICLFCPLLMTIIAVVKIILSSILQGLRYAYSYTLFTLIVKKLAKVPIKDTNLARRISGPGITRDIYYSLKIEDCMILVLLKLETIQYSLFQDEVAQYIRQNYTLIIEKYEAMIKVFSENYIDLKNIATEKNRCEMLVARLNTQVYSKINSLVTLRSNLSSFDIRFGDEDLERLKVVTEAILIASIKRYRLEKHIWEKYNIYQGHYKRLTHSILLDVFDQNHQVLSPLSDIEQRTILKRVSGLSSKKQKVLENILEGRVLLDDFAPTTAAKPVVVNEYVSNVDVNSVCNLYTYRGPINSLERHLFIYVYE